MCKRCPRSASQPQHGYWPLCQIILNSKVRLEREHTTPSKGSQRAQNSLSELSNRRLIWFVSIWFSEYSHIISFKSKGLTKGSRQHCFVLLNTRTCLEGNPHVHRPCGIRRFHPLSDSQIYYREHHTSSDSLYSGIHIVMILICLLFGVLIYLQIVWRKKPNEKRHTALAICSILIET